MGEAKAIELVDDEESDDGGEIVVPDPADPGSNRLGREIVRAIATGVFVGGRALIEHHRYVREREQLPAADSTPTAPSAPEPREVMSVDEAAAFLGLDRNTVYDACGRSQIPHRRIGKRILLSRSQLVAWLGACKAARVGNG